MTDVLLYNPKHEINVANALRNCSAFNADSIGTIGSRWRQAAIKRKARPFRMKQYQGVEERYYLKNEALTVIDRVKTSSILIAIEVAPGYPYLRDFSHPVGDTTYLFGPEDGNIPNWIMHQAAHIIQLDTAHCLNLANTVGIVLYDREAKRWTNNRSFRRQGSLLHDVAMR